MASQSSSILGGIVGGVANMAGSAVQAAGKVASSGLGTASSIASSTIGSAGSIASQALGTSTSIASSALGSASSIASSAIGTASSLASGTLNTATSIANSAIGTVSGVMSQAMGLATDATTKLLTEISNVANGALDGAGGLINDTMNVAQNLASGALNTTGELAQSILGDTSETLAKCCGGCCGGAFSSYQASQSQQQYTFSVNKDTSKVLEQVSSAMNMGLSYIKTFSAITGSKNGATSLLLASLDKAMGNKISMMMKKIVSAIMTAHGITHPLFMTIFEMTWGENKQWLPKHFADEKRQQQGDGVIQENECDCICNAPPIPKCVWDVIKEIPEYFDFVQKVMGGSIADIMYQVEDMIMQIYCDCDEECGCCDWSEGKELLPPLKIPLMSISKQMEDLMRKIYVLKEMIRARAKKILEKLKKLEAPELYICKPKEFELILWTLVEAEFIMNNLPIVMDKILEYFMNLFVKKFAEEAQKIIDKIFEVWKKVIEIVPPLQDLIQLCWAIPNQADACCNLALNAALQIMWPEIKPYVDMPFQCISMVSSACDEAQKMMRESEKIM